MRCSINVPNLGEFSDPTVFLEVARRTEDAGWDALFVWDHMVHVKADRLSVADPWVLLGAAAAVTRRIRLGTMVTPVARRRPHKLAREVSTLDRLSNGRAILGVGLGAPIADEFGSFGEPTDPVVIGARLDEGLDLLARYWSGESVTFRGEHFVADDVVMLPAPVQRPRPPVWVGGFWPARRPMRRAARWDGAIPLFRAARYGNAPAAADVREVVAYLGAERRAIGIDAPLEMVVGGESPVDPDASRDLLGPLADAGATWWDERIPFGDRLLVAEPMLRRIDHGPPAVW